MISSKLHLLVISMLLLIIEVSITSFLINSFSTTKQTKVFSTSLNTLIENYTKLQDNLNLKKLINKPLLSILVTDLDLNTINFVMDFPVEIALGLSAHSRNLDEIFKTTYMKQKKLFLNLPMESNNPFQKSGKLSLKSYDITALDIIISNYAQYLSGVYTDSEEILSNHEQLMKLILSKLYNNNLSIYYSGNNPYIEEIASELGIKYVKPDFIIEDRQNEYIIQEKILEIKNQILDTKKERFFLSIYGSANNIRILNKLLVDLQKDFIIVPIDV